MTRIKNSWSALLKAREEPVNPKWRDLIWQNVAIDGANMLCQAEYVLPAPMTAEEEAALAAFLLSCLPPDTQVELVWRPRVKKKTSPNAEDLPSFQAQQDAKMIAAITALAKSRDAGCFVGPIYGKPVNGDVLSLAKLDPAMAGGFISCGEIVGLTETSAASGKSRLTLTLAADGVVYHGHLSLAQEQDKEIIPLLPNGQWVRFRGRFFTTAKGKMLLIYALHGVNPPLKRSDKAPQKRVELCLLSKESALESVVCVTEALRLAACFGHTALAVTDKNALRALPLAKKQAAKFGIKLIAGFTTLLQKTGTEKFPLILLAKNEHGLQALGQLLSLAYENDPLYPYLCRAQIMPWREHLLLGAGDGGEPERYLKQTARQAFDNDYDYWQILPGKDRTLVQELLAFAGQQNTPLVASNEVRYLQPCDKPAWQALGSAADLLAAAHCFATTEEMLGEFGYLPAEQAYELVIGNPNRIAAQIESAEMPAIELAGQELSRKRGAFYLQKAKETWAENFTPDWAAFLQEELAILAQNNWLTIYESLASLRKDHPELDFSFYREPQLTSFLLGCSKIDAVRAGFSVLPQTDKKQLTVMLNPRKQEAFLQLLPHYLPDMLLLAAAASKRVSLAAAQTLARAYLAQQGGAADEKTALWLSYRSHNGSLGLDTSKLRWFFVPAHMAVHLPRQKTEEGLSVSHFPAESLGRFYPHMVLVWPQEEAFVDLLREASGKTAPRQGFYSKLDYYRKNDPLVFYAAALNRLAPEAKKEKDILWQKLAEDGLTVLPADLHQSVLHRYEVCAHGLLAPLEELPGLDAHWAELIFAERQKGPFLGKAELQERLQAPPEVLALWQNQAWFQALAADRQISLF